MASTYVVTFTNGTVYTTLSAGVIDSKLGISLIGSNYVGYGQIIANNFVRLLENQANDIPPAYPVAGQLWWDTANQSLNYYDGNKFKPCSSSLLGPTPPLSPLDGDQWWDTTNNQLKVWNSVEWMVVGPNYTKGQGVSGLINKTVTDNASVNHLVSELTLDATTIAIVSDDSRFTLSANIAGMTDIRPGINLAPGAVLNGTAANADQLGNVSYSDYLRKSVASNTLAGSLVIQGLNGLAIGNLTIAADNTGAQWISSNAAISVRSGNATITSNGTNGTITVNQEPTVLSSVATKNYVDTKVTSTQGNAFAYTDSSINNLVNGALLSTLHQVSAAIDNDASYHVNTDAKIGFKANAFNPEFDGVVSCRIDNTTDLGTSAKRFRHIYNTSISSTAADLAEKYLADAEYEPGTVVVFGGDAEVTVSKHYCDHRVAGVISTSPSYTMNDASTGAVVALTGKVPCKIIGPIRKGDIIVNSGFEGVAMALTDNRHWVPGCVIGKSLMDDNNTSLRSIMIAVGRF